MESRELTLYPLPSSTVEILSSESLFNVIENYIRYYATGEGHTARAKRYDLQYFLEFLAGDIQRVRTVRVNDWTLQATRDFVDARLALGESPATVNRRLATLKHLGRTLAERVPGFINPAREAKSPQIQPNRPQGMSKEEVDLLRRIAEEEAEGDPTDFVKQRNRFLIELLLSTGLRADEVRLLTLGQLSDNQEWLKNVKTKGKRFRNVYLESSLRPLLSSYLGLRELELAKKVPGYGELMAVDKLRLPLLISLVRVRLGQPQSFGLSPKSIWNVINSLGEKASHAVGVGSYPSLHPHKLRHTFAHGLLNSSNDVRLVAQALGHSDVRTTMRYTERSEIEIAQAIEKRRVRRDG